MKPKRCAQVHGMLGSVICKCERGGGALPFMSLSLIYCILYSVLVFDRELLQPISSGGNCVVN